MAKPDCAEYCSQFRSKQLRTRYHPKGAKCSKCKTTVSTPENKVKYSLCCKKCKNITHKNYARKYRKPLYRPPITTKIIKILILIFILVIILIYTITTNFSRKFNARYKK